MTLSALNPFFRAPNEIRLNISLTIIVFIGLVGLSWGYVELMEGTFTSLDLEELRLKLAGAGAVYGSGLAILSPYCL